MESSVEHDFWCHTCGKEIFIEGENLICPICGGDFVERLEEHLDNDQHQGNLPSIPSPVGGITGSLQQPTQEGIQQQNAPQGTTGLFDLVGQMLNLFNPYFQNQQQQQSLGNNQQFIQQQLNNIEVGRSENGLVNGVSPNNQQPGNVQQPVNNLQHQGIPEGLHQRGGTGFPQPSNPWGPLFQQIQTFTAQNMGNGPMPGRNTFVFETTTTNDPFGSLNTLVEQFLSSGNFGIQLYGNPGDYVWGSQQDMQGLLNHLFQQHIHQGNPPASESAITGLPEISIEQKLVEEGMDCSICKDEFQLSEKALQLPCKHLFHPSCIKRWLSMHNQCPVCRYELPTDDPEYERRHRRQETSRSLSDL